MNKQSGFAHIIIVIGLVALLLGALGFIFWQNFIDTDSSDVSEQETKGKLKEVDSSNAKNNDQHLDDEDKIRAALETEGSIVTVTNLEVIGLNAHGSVVIDDNGGMFWARKVDNEWVAYGVGADDYVGAGTAALYGFPTDKACDTSMASNTPQCWYYNDIDDSEYARNTYPKP
jgi:hypothetical protein